MIRKGARWFACIYKQGQEIAATFDVQWLLDWLHLRTAQLDKNTALKNRRKKPKRKIRRMGRYVIPIVRYYTSSTFMHIQQNIRVNNFVPSRFVWENEQWKKSLLFCLSGQTCRWYKYIRIVLNMLWINWRHLDFLCKNALIHSVVTVRSMPPRISGA